MRTVVIFTFAYVIDKLFEKTADAFTVVVKLSVQSAAGNTGRLMKNVSVGTGTNSTFKDGTAVCITLKTCTFVFMKSIVTCAGTFIAVKCSMSSAMAHVSNEANNKFVGLVTQNANAVCGTMEVTVTVADAFLTIVMKNETIIDVALTFVVLV